MGKHLSIEERLNAPYEKELNKEKIKQLQIEKGMYTYLIRKKYSGGLKAEYEAKINEIREEISELRYRNRKLRIFLEKSKKSKYNGLQAMNGVCYKMFGKKKSELTPQENTEYSRVMKERCMAKKEKANV